MRFALLLLLASTSAFAQRGDDPRSGMRLDFEFDVAPILAQKGCAAAKCHGGATGRGGFKLSLFSTDPFADHRAITRERSGRRVDFQQPQRSLLLRKPTEDLDHGGGLRLREDTHAYRTLLAWIEQGAPRRLGPPLELDALDLAWNEDGSALRATARFRDANRRSIERDVTDLAMFESTDERVASIDARGRVRHEGPGEAFLIARYAGRSAREVVRRPHGSVIRSVDDEASELDRLWLERLGELGLREAPAADPNTLVRRLSLDLLGRFPTPIERERFLAADPDTRLETTADTFLASRDFESHWAHHLNAWFEVPEPHVDRHYEKERHTRLRTFLARAIEPGRSLGELVRETLAGGRGSELVERFPDPRDRAEFAGRAFLGMNLGCARCHNHPGDRWTQEQHLAFSACFADGSLGRDDGSMMRAGALFHPETGERVESELLPLGGAREFGGREALVEFVLDPRHGAFERNAVNRVFHVLMGRTFYEPLDDARLTNPAVHEPLLEALAATFRAKGHDLRALIRAIVKLRAYRATSEPGTEDAWREAEWRSFARQEARDLPPRTFQRAVHRALDVPLPTLPPPSSPLAQRLNLLNGDLLNAPLAAPGNAVQALFDFVPDPQERLENLYLLFLSRPATAEERASFLPHLTNDRDGEALRDLAFALLASRACGVRR